MANVSNFQANRPSTQTRLKTETAFAQFPTLFAPSVASLFPAINTLKADLAMPPLPTCVRLNFKDLENFEVVDRQFQNWGIIFSNAIALQPSNPAFASRSGGMVLMGAPKSGWLEAKFLRPVHYVGAFITSSRSTLMVAYDGHDQPIAQITSQGANLASSNTKTPPNVQLSLHGHEICRITLYTFDGQLTVDDFSFSF